MDTKPRNTKVVKMKQWCKNKVRQYKFNLINESIRRNILKWMLEYQIYVNIYIYIYIYILYVCVCMLVYIYIYIYTYTLNNWIKLVN